MFLFCSCDVAKFSWFLEGHLVLTSAFGGDWRTRYLNAAALRRVSLVLPVPTVVAGMLCHMSVVDHDNMIRTTAALQQVCLERIVVAGRRVRLPGSSG